MHTTATRREVPYRGAMGGRLAIATVLLGSCVVGSAHAAPAPRPRLPPPPSLRTDAEGTRFERRADGALQQVNAEGRFVGVVYDDGRVDIFDLPDTRVEFTTGGAVVDWMLGFARAVESPTKDRPDLETPAPDREQKTTAGVQLMPPSPYGPAPILISVGGRFGGAADLAVRRGQRKQARAKQEFLDSTAPLRAALARAHEQEQRRTARVRLGQDLAALWRDESRSLADRKRELFERWDECEEAMEGGSETDAERGREGEEVRRKIEAFVRQVAPSGSPQAFDAAELSRLNAGRRSRQRFDPYARVGDAGGEDPAASGAVAR